ncbi:MCE-family protein [Mycobacterium sp. IS-1742]|uniref:MCE family protein n=1 Tax=Mycobacterium sp. IS-1742 TaxID=1772285 RepID=UPI00073FFADF|nr:MCE family protein [Mycobacterium sp. IS-1742]KUI27124.1 MCE-family protein [Mycobacterium sp. IS-1742]
MSRSAIRPLAGLGLVVAIALVVVLAIALFRGSFTPTVPVTVISDRAGLVMNPDADVKMRGVQVGTVDSIEYRADGTAALKLAMNPDQMRLIPGNVLVDIASSTVFGAKFVQMEPPPEPAAEALRPGQVLRGDHVTVEINTVFQQLTSVLRSIEPEKLNETLGAIAKAFNGRGEKFGETLTDLNQFLGEIEPSLPNLTRDIEMSAPVFTAYADAAPDLLRTFENTSRVSNTLVEQEGNLDTFLVSAIGLADIGNEVVGGNRQALTDVIRLLVPTSDLLNEYHKAINCSLLGMLVQMKQPPAPDPGIAVNVSFTMGVERYRYPTDLPKVAASGGPNCQELPRIPFESRPKYLVTDTGTNPWKYGNQGILLNSDGLKQLLFGPIAGPPRNTSQIGHPG